MKAVLWGGGVEGMRRDEWFDPSFFSFFSVHILTTSSPYVCRVEILKA